MPSRLLRKPASKPTSHSVERSGFSSSFPVTLIVTADSLKPFRSTLTGPNRVIACLN
jgi:hypothetical protein